jgi:hypothetical protein
MMNEERVWATCPLEVANSAVWIAREYGLSLGWSRLIPRDGNGWIEGEARPSLQDMQMHAPNCDNDSDIGEMQFSYCAGDYSVYFETKGGNTEISVSSLRSGKHTTRAVTIRRDNGDIVRGVTQDGRTEYDVNVSAWGARHVLAWERAWRSLGVKAPKFPATLRQEKFTYGKDEWPEDPLELEFVKVIIPRGAKPSMPELLTMLGMADSVTIYDEDGLDYPVCITDKRW